MLGKTLRRLSLIIKYAILARVSILFRVPDENFHCYAGRIDETPSRTDGSGLFERGDYPDFQRRKDKGAIAYFWMRAQYFAGIENDFFDLTFAARAKQMYFVRVGLLFGDNQRQKLIAVKNFKT